MVYCHALVIDYKSALSCLFHYSFYAIFDVEVKVLTLDRRNSLFMVMSHWSYNFIYFYSHSIFYMGYSLCQWWMASLYWKPNWEYYGDCILVSIKSLYLVGILLSNTGYTFCLIKTVFHFTPLHRCMSDSMSAFILWIIEGIQYGFKKIWLLYLGIL